MLLEIISKYVALYLLVFFAVILGAVLYKIISTSSYSYRNIRELTGSIADVLSGRSSTFHNGYRDHYKKAGLAVNVKSNEWTEQGTLSDESIDSILR